MPGVGTALINVGNGNLVLSVNDVNVAERGVALTFTRTYNSQSQHDANGTDGATPSVFGNGWTNTYDAHLAYSSAYNVVSVYDVDGARYDYAANGSGQWVAPPGEFAALTFDSANCTYDWTQTDGSTYYFEPPMQVDGCAVVPAGYLGRLVAVAGRNINNNITLTYSWFNGDASNPENLTQIVVTHTDGQSLTLSFGEVNGSGPTELASASRPDGSVVTYAYDSTGDLTSVQRPGNNVATTLGETYDYASGSYPYLLQDVLSPRYTYSSGVDGADVTFCYDPGNECDLPAPSPSGRAVTGILDTALIDFVPQDGTNTPLQPQYQNTTAPWTWRSELFSGYGSNVTTVTDSDGHARMWTTDGLWRPVELQSYSGSEWLVSYAAWDSSDDLVAMTDARDYETDYAYDGNGNVVAIAAPLASSSVATFRPTTLYSYDAYDNVTSVCDPVATNDLGLNWSGSTPSGDSLCPATGNGIAVYTWSYADENEPYGQLSSATTPNGYTYDVQYSDQSEGGGDYGLPTDVVGATAITQNDGSQRTPQQALTYDTFGNLESVSNGVGTTSATYDALNRLTIVTDPDGAEYFVSYYPDGLASSSLTPSEVADSPSQDCQDMIRRGSPTTSTSGFRNDIIRNCTAYSSTYLYDADGDETSLSSWVGGYSVAGESASLPTLPATTQNFYDGEDRLVEVMEPQDNIPYAPTTATTDDDLYTNPWITRYIYDISADGQNGAMPTFDGTRISAYGNLYETQELLPPLNGGTEVSEVQTGATPSPIANTQFQETKGSAYDALDRMTAQLRYEIGGSQLEQMTATYDGTTNSVGLLSTRCNAVQQCATYTYDSMDRVTNVAFNDSTPTRTTVYDPDGRIAAVTSSVFGTQGYTYDNDGNIVGSQEPSGGGVTSPATLSYHYYADDARASLDVASSGLSQVGLFQYAYRTDGNLKQLVVNDSSDADVGAITVAYTLDNAGNVTQVSENGGGGQLQDTGLCTGYKCPTGLQSAQDETQYSYDSFERLSQISLFPGSQYYGNRTLTYGAWDPVGNLIGDSLATSGGTTKYDTYEIDVNGRVAGSANGAGPSVYYANGMMVENQSSGDTTTWDARNSVSVSIPGSSFTFDGAGRLVGDSVGGYAMTASYDAENHLLGENLAGVGLSSYQWGPTGLPIAIGSQQSGGSFAADTLHYDGSQLLFTTNAQGQVDDIKVGTIGDITPLDSGFDGLTLWDRDVSGEVRACHNATGAAGNGLDAPWRNRYLQEPLSDTSPCSMQGANAPGWSSAWTEYPGSVIWNQESAARLFGISQAGHGGLLGQPRVDGFTDGFTTFQGVRTFDGNSGSWMEPDWYNGSVASTPQNQSSYEYNLDNPLMNVDATGDDSSCLQDSGNDCCDSSQSSSEGDCSNSNSTPTPQCTPYPQCLPVIIQVCTGLCLLDAWLQFTASQPTGICLGCSLPSLPEGGGATPPRKSSSDSSGASPCTGSNIGLLVPGDAAKRRQYEFYIGNSAEVIGGSLGWFGATRISDALNLDGPLQTSFVTAAATTVGYVSHQAGDALADYLSQDYLICGVKVPSFP